MTMIMPKKIKCPMCRKKWEELKMTSTNAFGSPDLDRRPAPMMRSTMRLRIDECPKCGYVFESPEDEVLVKKSFLKEKSYITCDGFKLKSHLAKIFYRYYLILLEAGQRKDAIFELLHAVWACDDAWDENAVLLRKQLVLLIDEELNENYDENLDMIRADVLRRSRQFDRVISEYQNKEYSEDLVNKVIRLQIELSEKKDDECHLMSEAEGEDGQKNNGVIWINPSLLRE